MMQSTRYSLAVAILVTILAAMVWGQSSNILDAVCTTSQGITAYSATIRMTQYQSGDISEIEFAFDFVPPDRMRIVYTAPATVEGQTMILNADKFYTYIASLRRSVWQDVGEGGSNQGEEMGFLYDFVTRSAMTALEEADIQDAERPESFVLENTGETLDVDAFALVMDDEREVILVNAFDAAPVSISIYSGDELKMEILVLEYHTNGAFDEAWFAIPEK